LFRNKNFCFGTILIVSAIKKYSKIKEKIF